MAHAKSGRYLFQTKWSKIFLNSGLEGRLSSYSFGKVFDTQNSFHFALWKYEYVKVPFRLAQASAYFQELMTRILKDFNFAIAYLDDIIIFSKTAEGHLSHIRKIFKKLRSAKLSMKLSKCHFFKEIQYLGHILSTKGIHPLPSKTQAI